MYFGDAFDVLELDTIDARFEVRPDRGADDVAVVAVDDVTFNELNLRWPFKRSLHAQVIDRLQAAGAEVIAYDVQFTEPLPTSTRTTPSSRPSIAPIASSSARRRSTPRAPAASSAANRCWRRSAPARGTRSSIRTRAACSAAFLYAFDGLEGFAVVATELATGRQIDPATFGGEDGWIDYLGPPGSVPTYSFSRVLDGQFPPAAFRGSRRRRGRGSAAAAGCPFRFRRATTRSCPALRCRPTPSPRRCAGCPLKQSGAGMAGARHRSRLAARAARRAALGTRAMLATAALAACLYAATAAAAFRAGLILPVVHPLGALGTGDVRHARRRARAGHARTPARARRVRPVRSRGRRQRGARESGRRPARWAASAAV